MGLEISGVPIELAFIAISGGDHPMSKWQFDPMHTQVEFSAKHLGMMTDRGTFNDVTTEANLDPEHPEKSSFSATINTESIRTHNDQPDPDLRSSSFLDIDTDPTIPFKNTHIDPLV